MTSEINDGKKRAVIEGTYSDFKLVKTRKVVQMVIEVPVEQSHLITESFGIPQPHEEIYVVVARVRSEIKEIEIIAKAIQQAGILGQSSDFGEWLSYNYSDLQIDPYNLSTVQQAIRTICGIKSRADMRTDFQGLAKWQELYKKWKEFRAGNA